MSAIDTARGFFESRGWSSAQSAGIAANLIKESSINPRAVGDGGRAYGIAQWHPDRQANFTTAIGGDIRQSTLEQQLSFVDWELRNTESAAGNRLKQAKSPEEAAGIVSKFYERPKAVNAEMRERGEMAAKLAGNPVSGGWWESLKTSVSTGADNLDAMFKTPDTIAENVAENFDLTHIATRIAVGVVGAALLIVGIAKWR